MELDHIDARGDGGADDINNAIPVCFDCHAEIHSYNPRHPRGRKFSSDELRAHKAQWLDICEKQPQVLVSAPRHEALGPIQALLDELDYDIHVVLQYEPSDLPPLLAMSQFDRAIAQSSFSILRDDLKSSLLEAYRQAARANGLRHAVGGQDPLGAPVANARSEWQKRRERLFSALSEARKRLFTELTSGDTG